MPSHLSSLSPKRTSSNSNRPNRLQQEGQEVVVVHARNGPSQRHGRQGHSITISTIISTSLVVSLGRRGRGRGRSRSSVLAAALEGEAAAVAAQVA